MCTPNDLPLVSIVMPAYNCENYITDAINSIVEQKYSNWELIVVDDCSTDNTINAVKSFTDKRIACFRNRENFGPAVSRNRGIEIAEGKYIALLDSDDIWHDDKLKRQVELAEKTGADIIYCSYGLIDSEGKKTNDYIVPESTNYDKMLIENVMSCSTVLIKADLLKKHKFDCGYYHEDYKLWLELMSEGNKAIGISDVMADYRVLDCSRSGNKLRSAKERWKIYRKALGMNCLESSACFLNYAINGVKKYC